MIKPILKAACLLPVLSGAVAQARGGDDSIGYELSGNQAFFKGDFKLVQNLPPVGDGQWHLFNLRADPGETQDLQQQQSALFSALQSEQAAWARSHGVLPMPAGYSPTRQVVINTFVKYWIPAYKNVALALLVGLLVLLAAGWKLRRRKRSA